MAFIIKAFLVKKRLPPLPQKHQTVKNKLPSSRKKLFAKFTRKNIQPYDLFTSFFSFNHSTVYYSQMFSKWSIITCPEKVYSIHQPQAYHSLLTLLVGTLEEVY